RNKLRARRRAMAAVVGRSTGSLGVIQMETFRALALCLGAGTVVVALAAETRISDQASAVEAAKRYLKARCTAETPCKFRAEREANQWRVWVELPRRSVSRGPAQQIVLFFDVSGNLIR